MAPGEADEVTDEARPQRKRKAKKRKERCPEPAGEVPAGPGYAVGQVAGSLRSSEGVSGPLALLFSPGGPPAALIYAPAPAAPRKGLTAAPRKEPALQPPPAKKPKAQPASEARLSAREGTLQAADQHEAQRELQARARRQERQGAPGEPGDAEETRRRLPRSPAAERIRSRRTVFVGNLPVAYTKQALRGLFRPFGPIESVRFRSVARAEPGLSRRVAAIQRRVHPKRQSLHAYVVFLEEEAAARALARNGAQVEGGLNIRVDRVAGGDRGHDNRRSAFVGNLSYDLEDQALREHFAQCGPVEAVRIIRDRETGAGKGFGYVLFGGTDGVQLAMKLNGSELLGRKVRVKRCMQQDATKQFAGYRHSQDARDKAGKNKSAEYRHPDSQGKIQSAKIKPSKKLGDNKPTTPHFKGKIQPAKRKPSKKLKDNKPTKQNSEGTMQHVKFKHSKKLGGNIPTKENSKGKMQPTKKLGDHKPINRHSEGTMQPAKLKHSKKLGVKANKQPFPKKKKS